MVAEIVGEMDYLRVREQKLRDTNESTNTRVKWFGMLTTFLLIALWAWQIMYLRAYFRLVCDVFCFIGREFTAVKSYHLLTIHSYNFPQVQASHLIAKIRHAVQGSGLALCYSWVFGFCLQAIFHHGVGNIHVYCESDVFVLDMFLLVLLVLLGCRMAKSA